jgi:hypothetical protein
MMTNYSWQFVEFVCVADVAFAFAFAFGWEELFHATAVIRRRQ